MPSKKIIFNKDKDLKKIKMKINKIYKIDKMKKKNKIAKKHHRRLKNLIFNNNKMKRSSQ